MQSNRDTFLEENEREQIEAQERELDADYQRQMDELADSVDYNQFMEGQIEREAASFQPLNFFQRGLKKAEIKEMADTAVENVLINGNPLEVAEALSAMETFIKELKDNSRFKNYVREEATKTPKGFVSKSGAKIEICEVGSKYDFSKCNDQTLMDYEESFQTIDELVKERKEFLKTVPVSGLDVMTAEGELVKIFPPSKSSTSSYKITLAK